MCISSILLSTGVGQADGTSIKPTKFKAKKEIDLKDTSAFKYRQNEVLMGEPSGLRSPSYVW